MKLAPIVHNLLSEGYSDLVPGDYGWLYFLLEPYARSGMKIDSWKSDKRFYTNFLDTVQRLQKYGLVTVKDGNVQATNTARGVAVKWFIRNEKHIRDNKFPAEKIGGGPGLFMSGFYSLVGDDSRASPKYKRELSDNLSATKLSSLKSWLKTYMRVPQRMNKIVQSMVGKYPNELFKDQPYTLYRGIFFGRKENAPMQNIVKGKMFKSRDNLNMSWTTDFGMASDFAMGKDNWMTSRKLNPGSDVGIVLRYHPTQSEMLIDLGFVDKQHPSFGNGFVDFDESEVICLPKRNAFIIDTIYS